MTDSYDLDALADDGEPFRFTFDGQGYELPADIDLSIVGQLQAGDLVGALQALIGADDWAKIVASPKTFGAKKVAALLDAYAKHIGVGSLGGSSASTES